MKTLAIDLKQCPSCGSAKIKKVRRNWTAGFHRKRYTVPNLEFHECANCGEKVYDPQAMRRIEAASPAFTNRKPPVKRSA